MKIFVSILAALVLSGCALFGDKSLADEWAVQQSIYNVTAQKIIELREPCVISGPEDPGCILDDEAYRKVRILQTTADGYLKAADARLQAGDSSRAKFYITSAAGALLAIRAMTP